jgi:transglutaminase-like putative cysteine protease
MAKRSRVSRAVLLVIGVLVATRTGAGTPPRERALDFSYVAEVSNIPAEAHEVALWLPYPVSNAHQEVSEVKVTSPFPTRVGKDPEYGNSVLYLREREPKNRSFSVEVSFRVVRREYVRRPGQSGEAVEASEPDLARWLKPDRLVPINARVRALSAEVTQGKGTDLEKARAIYDYVVSTMKYDKSGTGWGNGDFDWACDAKRGNCTDFHAVFIGLVRAAGIPAKFSIGFPLPEARGEGEVPGYHCWAEFYLRGYGWVPVDASEASKHPEKREYFFGAHDENRVQLSLGRDVVLNPAQKGPPLNYFVYPYAEVDGVPFSGVQKKTSYKDLRAEAGASSGY